MMRKDEVEDVFRSMMLEHNLAHDFWCLPPGIGSYYIFQIRIFHSQEPEVGIKWETQINIGTVKMDGNGTWHLADHGIKRIQNIIQEAIDKYDKNTNRGKV